MAKIRGGKVKSVKTLKSSLKKGGGTSFLTRVRDEGLVVRFLTEPDEWYEFFEYYDSDAKQYRPEVEGVKPNLGEGDRVSKKWLANAIDTENNKVVPLVFGSTVAKPLIKFYEKYNTLLDREYEITREGTGRDTEYSVMPEPPSPLRGRHKFELLDLEDILSQQVAGDVDDDDDDDDDWDDEEEEAAPAPKKKSRPAIAKAPAGRKPMGKKKPMKKKS